ncbi:MAG: PAS domain S-box protein, partial [Vallitaleaceae bacterium]|nr:PAS domain S-box protein [Vallitaleaceae bacterium]
MKNRGYKPLHFEKQEIVVERTRDEKTILENDVEQVRENYNNFLDSTNDLLFVIDLKGEILHINKTVTKRLGYIEADLIGRSVLQVYPENRREEAEKSIEDILAADLDVSSVPFITKNGLMIPVETSLVRGEWNGQPVLFGVAKDISKQKKSEEKFTRAFQTGGVLMAISSIEEGRFMDVNETFINTLDFQRADVVGKSANELDLFFDPEQREKIKKQYETFGSAHGIEVVLKGKDNKNHTMLVSVDPFETENQDLPCWLTTMVDISERKRIEQKVAASEAKHKAMINNISDVITIIDEKGIVKYKSANIEKWFGWLPQELINTDICLTVHPDDVEIVLKAFHALQEKDGLIKNLEYRFKCKDGNYKDIEMTAVNLLNDTNINGILMNYKDITEHKKIAEKILFLNYHDVLTGLYNRRFYEKEIIRMDTEDNLPI